MHAHHTSARLAPKKANLMAQMVRGMTVPAATELLRKTSKKSARLFETVLRSAVANAEHNFKQNAQSMVLKSVVVNQGTSYRRGTPMARGRVRPIRKFLCHISITLGFANDVHVVPRRKSDIVQKNQKNEESVSPVVSKKSTVSASPKGKKSPSSK